MVYESDFYTTRRPYSRPLVSSYTVTYRPIVLPLSSIIQLRSIPHMPYVAHKRLVTIIHSPIHHVYYAGAMVPIRVRARVRPSVLFAEFNRIRDLPRPSSRSYLEDYLNSRYNILFDDETREIRARVDSLLRRVHVFVPRALASDFLEEIVPERMRSHDYVRRLLSGRNIAKKQIEHLGWYDVPDRGAFGTLACVKYVAGRPQSVRKPYFKVADLRPADIRNDVNFLSYYSKNRQAAATACKGWREKVPELYQTPGPGQHLTERELRKARALGEEYTPQQEKTTNKPAPEPKSEPELEVRPEKKAKKKEPEPIPEPEPMKEPEPAPELAPEPAKEPEPTAEAVAEPVKPSKSVKGSRSAKAAKAAKAEVKAEPAPKAEPAKEPEAAKEAEPAEEPEPVKEAEPVPPEAAAKPRSITESEAPAEPENVAPSEGVQAVSDEAKEDEDEKVRQEKEDAIKKAEEYLRKVAREAQTEEERRKIAEAERVALEMEEKKAWEALQLAQERKAEMQDILENERQEVERKVEEAKLEAEREEAEKVAEEERIINQTRLNALIQEQERLIVEEHLEEVQQQKQEQEERVTEVALPAEDEPKDVSCAEEPATGEVTDQEREEKLYEATTDDDTRVEEENAAEEEHAEVAEHPFVEEPEGAESKPQTGPMATSEDAVQIEEVTSGEEFEWGDQDS